MCECVSLCLNNRSPGRTDHVTDLPGSDGARVLFMGVARGWPTLIQGGP